MVGFRWSPHVLPRYGGVRSEGLLSSTWILGLGVVLSALPLASTAGQPLPISGDTVPEVKEGSRIRVTVHRVDEPLIGWVDRLQDGDLHLVGAQDHRASAIPVESIRSLELSLKRRSSGERWRPGLIVGGLVGAAGGLVLAASNVEDCSGGFCFDGLERLTYVAGGASVGMLAGGALSWSVLPAEEWSDPRAPTDLGLTELRRGVPPGWASVELVRGNRD